ncbi:MarR family winged helix-turn-helix transcriptional regulator [Nocardia stercoris]|uniref:MarR family transcriptional regulator n=1 Tax=Nocardia stercoris TaxID=2483361 RepID=A0A3M2KQK1_9NOCA|nr:MarR family transcriptional regulator [Nocardia stercoris]RMI27932.1 MarR family transcriptional regulator [Nocardia stercoris]
MSLGAEFPRSLLQHPTYVFGRLHKAIHAEVNTSLRDHWVLSYLAEQSDLTQQQVSDALAIDRSEVVRLIDGLERAGYVVRARDTEDRRKYRLSITKAGRDMVARTDERLKEAADRLLYRLTAEERRTLHRLALKAIGE